MSEKKLNGTVIVTYRCNARCTMCNRYKAPSKPDEEISLETIKKLPKMYFTNITGGEPFMNKEIDSIIKKLYDESGKITVITNGELLLEHKDIIPYIKRINLSLHTLDEKKYENIINRKT